MTNDHPPPDTPKILEVLEPFVDFCECRRRFGANDFAHRHAPPRGHGLHDNLVRRDYKISVFKKRIGMTHMGRTIRIRATDVDPLLEHLAQRGLGWGVPRAGTTSTVIRRSGNQMALGR